jgi:hypothetical protein
MPEGAHEQGFSVPITVRWPDPQNPFFRASAILRGHYQVAALLAE